MNELKIMGAKSLDELRDSLNNLDGLCDSCDDAWDEYMETIDFGSLPVFSKKPVNNKYEVEVFSWDDERVLVRGYNKWHTKRRPMK